jgi:hypothetical protein
MFSPRLRSLSLKSLWFVLVSGIASSGMAREPQSLWTRLDGQDWPRMLGENYDSTSSEIGIRTDWGSDGLRIVWSVETGVGYGNGVAAAGRWLQFDRFQNDEVLTCYHAETGKELWKWSAPVTYVDPYGYNNGPRCSPLVDQDRVYVYGVAGRLACIDVSNGALIWQRNLNDDYHVVPNFFGVGASPLIFEDVIWCMVGGSPKSQSRQSVNDLPAALPNGTAMVGLDKRTGQERFRIGNYLASYSAPVVRKVNDRDTGLAFVREGLMSFDPKEGKELSFTPWRSRILESVNGASPTLYRGKVLISETYEIGGCLLDIAQNPPAVLWRDGRTRPTQSIRAHWTTPLVVGDDIFVSSGRNEPDTDLRCVRIAPGKTNKDVFESEVQWSYRNRDRMTGLVVDNHIVWLGESGALQLMRLSDSVKPATNQGEQGKTYRPVAQMELANRMVPGKNQPLLETPSWAPPVLSHGLLYVRGANRVICLELIESKPK